MTPAQHEYYRLEYDERDGMTLSCGLRHALYHAHCLPRPYKIPKGGAMRSGEKETEVQAMSARMKGGA